MAKKDEKSLAELIGGRAEVGKLRKGPAKIGNFNPEDGLELGGGGDSVEDVLDLAESGQDTGCGSVF